MNYSVLGNCIYFGDQRSVSLPFAIGDTRTLGEIVVAILKLPPGESMNENVFGISAAGEKIWQISRLRETSLDPLSNQYCEIIGLGVKSGTIRISNWNGVVVDVDASNGNIESWYWGK